MAGDIEFHTGLAEPIGFACRLLRKALRRNALVLCTAPEATLAALDRALWVFDERDFVPHLRLPHARADRVARTPLWLALAADAAPEGGAGRVLVNLGAAAPASPALYPRLIELVAAEPDEAAAGRQRWRAYKAAGFDVIHHPAADTA
jgi:DNA polymerase III subunit chi